MPTLRSDMSAMPRLGGHDDDDDGTIGMGFSILVTVCSLIGMLFCFRRASRLLPRSLNIQLQMFGQNSTNNPGRGPIALSDDDLVGATGLEWEDLEAQLRDDDDDDENDDNVHGGRVRERGEDYDDQDDEMDDMARPLKPMSRKDRYLDEDEDDNGEGQELSNVTVKGRYRDDEDENEDEDDDEDEEFHDFVESAGDKKRDTLFKLEDGDSDRDA
ncbi:hypothetical protein BGZ99_009099 [Dissophora globulifera]|uniref:Uncharacterized protein n=1 Tax=Dissophora globulifera TaxID=979702 RepID=A0A9P6UNN9_9FUNG|nr:hypothetical protein BGZ99_009099 [Dissophora globulifera]